MATKSQTVKIVAFIKNSQVQKLNSKAKKEKTNRSALIRTAIDAYLKGLS